MRYRIRNLQNRWKQKKAQWPWHALTVLVLIGLAGALYYATSLMSYEWRWNRVPQYFAYHAEESQRAADLSTVSELVRKGDKAEVTLRNDAGDEQRLIVDDSSLQVAQGDDVAEGDVIGVTRHWAAGPLLWGLWTTLWLSGGVRRAQFADRSRHRSVPAVEPGDPATSRPFTSNWCAVRRCWYRFSFSTSSSVR